MQLKWNTYSLSMIFFIKFSLWGCNSRAISPSYIIEVAWIRSKVGGEMFYVFIPLHLQRKDIRIPNEIRTSVQVFDRPDVMFFKLKSTKMYYIFKEISIHNLCLRNYGRWFFPSLLTGLSYLEVLRAGRSGDPVPLGARFSAPGDLPWDPPSFL